jgi:hypothetical protein
LPVATLATIAARMRGFQNFLMWSANGRGGAFRRIAHADPGYGASRAGTISTSSDIMSS